MKTLYKIISDEFLYIHIPKAEDILLNKIPKENELSYKFSYKFNKKMKILLKYERRSPTMRRMVHHIKVAAAVFLITLSIMFGTVMSVEAYRMRLFEFVTQVWEELTSVVIHSDDNLDYDKLVSVSPYYIPNGYTVLKVTNSRYEHTIIYSDEEGIEIYYSQALLTQGETIFDTENTAIQTKLIGSQEVSLINNKGITQIYWHDSFSSFSLVGKIGEIELLKMAESIIN